MKSETPKVFKLESITQLHRIMDLPGPVHPLVTLIEAEKIRFSQSLLPDSYTTNLYKITLITKLGGKFKYGQGYYDFDEGSMLFTAPNQVVGGAASYEGNEGFSLLFHPDFLQGHPLVAKMKQYGFFAYTSNEALHLSEQESSTILSIYSSIRTELNSRIDDFSREVLISHIELLLSYSKRFYKRQFCTRQVATSDLLEQLENLLNDYFEQEKAVTEGIPTVQLLAEHLNYSPNYLSDMLRSLTGLNAQQHIHQKLIERAKQLLSTTNSSISEIAYHLGFEQPQSFSRLFKIKTQTSPGQFRAAFN
jgi:AraC family transcriptional activator of pobA